MTARWLHAELREMRQFVKGLGLTGRLAQMLVERHGKNTEARLKRDPYLCLHGMPGVTFRSAARLLHGSLQSFPPIAKKASAIQGVILMPTE